MAFIYKIDINKYWRENFDLLLVGIYVNPATMETSTGVSQMATKNDLTVKMNT